MLSYRSKRFLRIAEILLLEEGFVTFDEIRDLNNCSNKTVYNDIAFLQEQYQSYLHLEVISNTVRSQKMVISEFINFRNLLIKKSLHTKIMFEIAFSNKPTMYSLCSKLVYSESRIRNVISELNKYLKKYRTRIVKDSMYNHYYFESENIAGLLMLMIFLLGDQFFDYVPKEMQSQYQTIYNEHMLLYPRGLPDYLEVTIQKYYLLYQRLSNRTFLSSQDPLETIYSMHSKRWQIKETIEKEVKEITFLNLNEENLEKLNSIILYYAYYQKIAPEKFMKDYNRCFYFYHQFAKENPKMTQEYEKLLASFSKKISSDLAVYKEEILFCIYTFIPNLRFYKRLRIAVYSDLYSPHAYSLLLTLKKHFPMHDYFLFQENSVYDFIITTCSDQRFGEIPYILVSDYISVQDIYRIYHRLYIMSSPVFDQ